MAGWWKSPHGLTTASARIDFERNLVTGVWWDHAGILFRRSPHYITVVRGLNWASLWVYDISARFIAGFDMISLLPALYTVNGDPGDAEPRHAGSRLLQVLSFSSAIHLFTQLCLNQFY